MGKKHLFGNTQNVHWNLGDIDGNKFEDKIYKIVTKELSSYFEFGLKINHTKRSNDGGKDIVIISPVDIDSLFGISFRLKGKERITIHLECKTTQSDILRYEKIIPSTVKNRYQNIDYFFLVTNSEILPKTYYIIEDELKQNEIEFKLADQYILAKSIKGKYDDLFKNVPICNRANKFYGEYQIFSIGNDIEYKYEIYFLFRNYGKKTQNCRLTLVSDINWSVNKNGLQFMIEPYNNFSKKIEVSSSYYKGLDDLTFRIEKNRVESFIFVQGAKLNEFFTPPFIGKKNQEIRDSICEKVKKSTSKKLFAIWGVAGIGKTRIINEIILELNGTNFDFFKCSLKKNNASAISKIKKFLKDKDYYSNNPDGRSLSETIIACNNSYRNAIIIIDDFHYAKIDLIHDIKNLQNHNAPIILIISGRTDYSYGSLEYYRFIQWTRQKLIRDEFLFDVEPLKEDETIRLIKILVNKIPDIAINILLKKSMNTPLYITQFIEYLIGEKLVYIKNRNTVGITDVSLFNSRNFIPDKISEIYKRRLEHLKREKRMDCIDFLYILSVYNGEISHDLATKFYDESNDILPELLLKRFLIQENGTYQFIHESFLVFISKQLKRDKKEQKRIAKIILEKQKTHDIELSGFIIGRLFLWIGEEKEAKNKYNPIVKIVQNSNNFSNLNIDLDIYDFLYDVFDLYKNSDDNQKLLINLLNIKIYITLHHLIPFMAVHECDKCLELIDNSDVLKSKGIYYNSITSQKAHALLNSGKNWEGFLILNQLQASWIISKNDFQPQTLFEIMDRLCAIYIKYNNFNIALDYNDFEIKIAEEFGDSSIIAIAYRTRSKLFYLNDYKKCLAALNQVDDILKSYDLPRIQINNEIYRIIVELSYTKEYGEYDNLLKRILDIEENAIKHKFNRAIIQSKMVTAAIYLKRNQKGDVKLSKQSIELAINYSIQFGIPGYMWQLYNLLGIIATKQKEDTDVIMHYFETMYSILDTQGLLYIGKEKICYSSVLAISNYGFFWQRNDSEQTFNEKLSKINYWGKENKQNPCYVEDNKASSEYLKTLFIKSQNNVILFFDIQNDTFLRDNETKYFIALT